MGVHAVLWLYYWPTLWRCLNMFSWPSHLNLKKPTWWYWDYMLDVLRQRVLILGITEVWQCIVLCMTFRVRYVWLVNKNSHTTVILGNVKQCEFEWMNHLPWHWVLGWGGDSFHSANDVAWVAALQTNYVVLFNVTVTKGSDSLVFECESDGAYLDIQKIMFEKKGGNQDMTDYLGPVCWASLHLPERHVLWSCLCLKSLQQCEMNGERRMWKALIIAMWISILQWSCKNVIGHYWFFSLVFSVFRLLRRPAQSVCYCPMGSSFQLFVVGHVHKYGMNRAALNAWFHLLDALLTCHHGFNVSAAVKMYEELEEELKGSWESYLEERGINAPMGDYLLQLAHDKEQREYMSWLQKVKTFVAK